MANNFIDILFGIAQGFVKEANKTVEKYNKDTERSINNYTRRYSERSNDELIERFKNSTIYAEKVAIKNIINSRKNND